MFASTPIRDPKTAEVEARAKYDHYVEELNDEVKAIERLEYPHQRVLLMIDLWYTYISGTRLHIWQQNFDERFFNAYRAIALAADTTYVPITRLLETTARRAQTNQIRLVDDLSLLFIVLAARLPASQSLEAFYQYVASHWDDTVDPLSIAIPSETDRVMQTYTTATKPPYIRLEGMVLQTDSPDLTGIYIEADNDTLDDITKKIVFALWSHGVSADTCEAIIRLTATTDFFYKVHDYVPYRGVTNDTELQAVVESITAYQTIQHEMAAEQANPFYDPKQGVCQVSVVAPDNLEVLSQLEALDGCPVIDVHTEGDTEKAARDITMGIRGQGGGSIVVSGLQLQDETFATHINELIMLSGTVVVIGGPDAARPLEKMCAMAQIEIRMIE